MARRGRSPYQKASIANRQDSPNLLKNPKVRGQTVERLSSVQELVVGQKKEWGEILTGFEGLNRYVVSDQSGTELFYAVEERRSVIARIFLKAYRPFAIDITDPSGDLLIRIERPFRFYFHQADILDASGRLLGSFERRFSVFKRLYSVVSANGKEVFDLVAPLLHPWTFKINQRGREVGMIQKKWGGLLKEGFTDADTFGVTVPQDWDVELKALALGGVFLIDFVHFENRGN